MLNDVTKAKLLPYQLNHTNNLIYSINIHNRGLDASDTGTGKTYSSIALCVTLGLKPLIIGPKAVITSWKRAFEYFGWDFYGITNYESIQNCKMFTKQSFKDKVDCPWIKRIEVKEDDDMDNIEDNKIKIEKKPKKNKNIVKKQIIETKEKSKDTKYTYVWNNLPNDIIIIFDEAHRCKNPHTLNSVLLYTLAKTTAKILMLSATLSDKPENFALAGYVLGLYPNIRNAKNWMLSISKDCSISSGIHQQLYPEYASRMRIRDLGKLFPDNQVCAVCYDMANATEIQEQYKIIEEEYLRLKKNEESSGCALARILYCRMKIEMLKVPTYIKEAKKYMEEGNAVAIFVNFTQSLQTIADELNTNCVIHGQQTLEERDKAIADFNNDKSQIIICNIQSGGVGLSLHDLNGNFPRVAIVSPGYSAQMIIQALGRVHRANGKTPVRQRIVFCSNTLEEEICENMKEKIKNIAMLNDNDLDSYQIEGLMDDVDAIGIDKHKDLSEFDKLFLKINALNIKKQRLEMELADTIKEINGFEIKINNHII